MTDTFDLFCLNYLDYNRSIKIAVGLEIDIDTNNQPTPPEPVGPSSNEIWYWGEYYDLANAVTAEGITYVGPSILSNEKTGDKYVITFDGSVTKLGYESGEFYPIFMNDLLESSNITRIEIPNSVIIIGDYAFGGCTGLTSMTIPNSVTSIGNYAFASCTGLSSVTIPNNITSIGEAAFYGCNSLSSVMIPDSVTNIGAGAFTGCTSLTSITIGNSITNIGEGAFSGCTSLSSVTCEAITPPALGDLYVFDSTNDCPIYVPVDSVNAYKAAENWSTYAGRIQAIS